MFFESIAADTLYWMYRVPSTSHLASMNIEQGQAMNCSLAQQASL